MADGLTTASRTGSAGRDLPSPRMRTRYRLVPWWVRISVVYVLARVVTGGLLMLFARAQTTNSFTGASPGYFSFASIWDGAWYRVIVAAGYPSTLPVDTSGHISQNAWAFMPAYPLVVRGLMTATGGSFEVVAVMVSFLFGWGAALLFHSLMRRRLAPGAATFATVLFCVAPVSAMFQVAYAESMAMFLLLLALHLLLKRRHFLMLPVVALLGMTRPMGLAFALLMVLVVVLRWVRPAAFGDSGRPPLRALVPPVIVAVVSGLVGLAWPAIAWLRTGRVTAYTDTELAWRADYIGWHHLTPFTPWVEGFAWWFHEPLGAVLLVVALIVFGVFVCFPPARALSMELRLWAVAYLVYLLAVFFPQSSTWRVLLPLAPLLGIVAVPWSRGSRPAWVMPVYRGTLIVGSIALQWAWMYYCWWINGYDWTPP